MDELDAQFNEPIKNQARQISLNRLDILPLFQFLLGNRELF